MPRRRYLDRVAPSDNTYNSIRPVARQIQVKKKDTPARRQEEERKAEIRRQQARVTPANPRQASIGPYREKTAIDKAGGRLYAAGEQRRKDAEAREEAGVALTALFKPVMPSTYYDMYKAYKNGEVTNVGDALAAPYLTSSWSHNNPGKALAMDIVAPFAISKGSKLAKFAGNSIANDWRNMRYALAHPESQTYGIVANSPYSIKTLPGYHIGSLQRGNVLEKQLSKVGTISKKSIQAVVNNPNTSKVDKYILKQVLNNHANDKVVDYNMLRHEAQQLIPKYSRVPQTKFADYGAGKLGLTPNIPIDEPYLARSIPEKYWSELKDFNPNNPMAFDPIDARELYLYDNPEVFTKFQDIAQKMRPDYNTFTFESPGFIGDTKHYSGKPIGHSRTYVTSDEPQVLHVMESQSDWAQSHPNIPRGTLTQRELDAHGLNIINRRFKNKYPDDVKKANDVFNQGKPVYTGDFSDDFIEAVRNMDELKIPHEDVVRRAINRNGTFSIEKRLVDTHLQRQLQENMLYGAENGQTMMRYPTSETAAKIEGYQKTEFTPEYSKALDEYNGLMYRPGVTIPNRTQRLQEVENKLAELEISGRDRIYSPQHQTILNKYREFPKMFNRLFKGQQVRTITDGLGNSWYEVDIPKDMLQRELKFKRGGKIC